LSRERLWQYSEVLRVGFADHWVANPWRLSVTTVWPRAVLQCLFFALVGEAANNGDISFAFVGSVALVITQPTSVGVPRVAMTDKFMGTFYRIRLGRLPAASVIAIRAVPWLLEALIMVVASIVIVGASTNQTRLAARLLELMPIFVVMTVTGIAGGVAVGSFAVGHNLDVLLGNALTYLIIAAGGMIVPTGRVPWLDAVGTVLPLRNGLLAVRGILAGGPWAHYLLLELAVGVLWSIVAVLGFHYHGWYARRHGADAFA
jgi:ABC-2 type transport system permease protein